jgi:hypothetical protein
MDNHKSIADGIAYTLVAWFQTLGSTRFQLTVFAIAGLIYYEGRDVSLTQISILIISWILGESIRPHASIKKVSQSQGELEPTSDNEKLLDDAIVKLNNISGPSSPVGPLVKACIDVLETARMVLVKFKKF